MSELGRTLIAQLDADDLATLAGHLRPLVIPESEAQGSEWLTPSSAAEYLGVTRKRVYDLTSSRQLIPDGRDGRTPLYRRRTLDAYARSGR